MFLSDILIQGIVLAVVVIIFLVAVILNQKTKAPKGSELPEKCQFCPSNTCVIRISDVEKIKEEIREVIDNCED